MTTQKDFKRLVRGRMQKTGESYTAARATLIGTSIRRKVPSADPVVAPELVGSNGAHPSSTPPADFARIAGMSDEKLKAKTGCTWEKWVWALDHVNAHEWPHRAIAEYVKEKYKVPDWWTQTVTVGYERIRGLREKGQRRSGSWEASKSKTVNAAVGNLFKAFSQPKLRSRWLPGSRVVVRRSTPNKSMRITWDDGTSVEVGFVSKGRSKAIVAVAHTKLPSRESSEKMKAFWTERLDVLAANLGAKPQTD